MSIERHFIGWNGSLAELTAKAILAGAAPAPGMKAIDLSSHRVIVPSQFAGRLIREQLAIQSPHGVLLPKIETPESFLNWGETNTSTATPTEALLTWIEVLEKTDRSELQDLFPGSGGGRFDFNHAKRFAKILCELRDELGGSATINDFAGVGRNPKNPEPQRWSDLAKLEERYRELLKHLGLKDHNDLRVELANGTGKPEGVTHIWLASISEPQPLFLTALKRIEPDFSIHILVGADIDETNNFDTWGRPKPEVWRERKSEWKDFKNNVHVVGSPNDSTVKLRQLLGAAKPQDCVHAVCACDRETDAPKITALIHSLGGEAINPLGNAHSSNPLHQTLSVLIKLLGKDEPDLAITKEAVLIPSILQLIFKDASPKKFTYINKTVDWADQYFFRGLLSDTCSEIQRINNTEEEKLTIICDTLKSVVSWRDHHLSLDWQSSLTDIVDGLIDKKNLDEDNLDDAFTLEVIESLFKQATQVNASFSSRSDLSHQDLMGLTLDTTAAQRFRRNDAKEAVNLPGWIEAPWEPVPHLIIFGLNDHLIPKSRHAHPFLPAKLCEMVGLPTNEEKFAAAAYTFEQLWRQRQESGLLDIIVPQQDTEGEPLRPSRLLFLGPDEQLCTRVQHLFTDTPNQEAQPYWEIPEEHKLIPLADSESAEKAKRSISATAFKDFLGNSAEYWLKRALKLNAVEYGQIELNNSGFGTLIHGALKLFGQEYINKTTGDLNEITEALNRCFDQHVRDTFGENPTSSITVQLESAKTRLLAFAPKQLELFKEGWLIHSVETPLPKLDKKDFFGVEITGTYDRLDVHNDGIRYRVYDYKTFKEAEDTVKKHLETADDNDVFKSEIINKKGKIEVKRWIDLQLPVYHLCVSTNLKKNGNAVSKVEVGYICLPENNIPVIKIWEKYTENNCDKVALETIKRVCERISEGTPEAFQSILHESEYPILKTLKGRPIESYMKINQLGEIRK